MRGKRMRASHDRNWGHLRFKVTIYGIPNQNSDSVLKMSQKDEPKGNVRTQPRFMKISGLAL
jgi:hypothetical protein